MKRYSNTDIKKTEQGKRVYKTTIYPDIKPKDYDIYIITKQGDRLDLLASKFYNDISKWPIIAQASGLGKGTLVVPPDKQIRIPNLKQL